MIEVKSPIGKKMIWRAFDTPEALVHLAQRKKQRYGSTVRWGPDTDELGMEGEFCGARFLRALPDLRNKPLGDTGIDIEALVRGNRNDELWIEINNKCSYQPGHLLVPASHLVKRRIYIQSGPQGMYFECLRWEWGWELAKVPAVSWQGGNALTHPKKLEDCRPMEDLAKRYLGYWRHQGLPEVHKAKELAPLFGVCSECGVPGKYIANGKWACEEHRVW